MESSARINTQKEITKQGMQSKAVKWKPQNKEATIVLKQKTKALKQRGSHCSGNRINYTKQKEQQSCPLTKISSFSDGNIHPSSSSSSCFFLLFSLISKNFNVNSFEVKVRKVHG